MTILVVVYAVFLMSILEIKKEEISALCESNKVERLYAFGSVLSEKMTEVSDIDLIVLIREKDPIEYSKYYFSLLSSLETLLNRPIDLLEEGTIRNPFLRQALDSQKVAIYAA